MLNSWVSSGSKPVNEEKLTGSDFVSKDNRNKVATPKPKFNPIVSRNMQDPTGQYMWLFSGTK
jgi:hypothetical protein